MNVLFCHDGPVNCDENNRYYSIGFNDKLLDRYAEVFESVGIVTRVNRTDSVPKFNDSDKLTTDTYRIIETPNYLTLKGLFASKRKSTKQLENEISRIDALIIRLPSFLGSKCVQIARKYHKPFLIELVGCPWDSLRNHSLSGKILAPYMYLITKYQVYNASDVLYVTNVFLQRRYPTRGRQIACSDVELQQDYQSVLCKSDCQENDRKFIIGTVGKIDLKYKGHATVIKAIKKIKANGYDVLYQIVGPGDKSNLEKYAMLNKVIDNVEFLGSMSHDDIFEWLKTIDIYVQPSLTEGMPRALIEAMSKGCPCVASDAGGMPELLDKKYIFPKGNAGRLAKILLNASENGLFAQGMRNRDFTKQFSPNVIKKNRLEFYQEFRKEVMKAIAE